MWNKFDQLVWKNKVFFLNGAQDTPVGPCPYKLL